MVVVSRRCLGWGLWLALVVAVPCLGDTVRLENGDVLSGTLVQLDSESLKLSTPYAGEIAIAAVDVVSLTTDTDVVVTLSDGREMSGRLVTDEAGAMYVDDGAGTATPLFLAEVSAIAPPPPPQPWFRYGGEISVGFNAATGNTETQGYHIALQLNPEFGDNAISVNGQLNRSEAKISGTDETTASNWRVLAQYNRFFTEKWYWLLNNGWENDDLKDLNLRITGATGVGYRVWNEAMRILSLELGPAYVYENFARVEFLADPDDPESVVVENPDRDYATARFALNFEHGLWNPSTRFYHNDITMLRLDDANTFILQTVTGLRFDLFAGILAAAEIQFDWNNDPAEGARKEDFRYLFKLGYAF